ncbi:iron ABC transporter permease [Shinella sp. S4-D37]|uniref:ABC transporter permease n=1 Tax=Shinella sp. S4-D37 TaxID=3161999 RepID=UPI00346550F2
MTDTNVKIIMHLNSREESGRMQRGARFATTWWSMLCLSVVMLPWYRSSFDLGIFMGLFARDENNASALASAIFGGHWWLWPIVAAAIAPVFSVLTPDRRRGDILLASGGAVGLAMTLLQAWAIGLHGWNGSWLVDAFGPLDVRQGNLGIGAAGAIICFLLLLTGGLARQGKFGGDYFVAAAVGCLSLVILIFTVWPVMTLFGQLFGAEDTAVGQRVLTNRIWGLSCVTNTGACGTAWNTLALAFLTASSCTILGLAFALIVARTNFRFRKSLRLLTILPIITPSFIVGMGLILIFGRSGVINQWIEWAFHIRAGRWIYGFDGVWLAQTFSFTPIAFLILIGVVEGVSPTLEEATQTLRASPRRTFWTVSLPLMMPGIANAFLISFIESLADFGNPLLLGASFNVLSTEIYFSVVGAQADFGQTAALALILLTFALVAFLVQQRIVGGKSYVTMSGKGDGGLPQPLPAGVRRTAFAIAIPWAVLSVAIYGLAILGGFVTTWGRDWTLTLDHFGRALSVDMTQSAAAFWTGRAWNSLFTTVELAVIAAPITAAIGLVAAWLFTRQRFAGRRMLEFSVMLSFCVPGTVIGVAYILTYNVPPLELTGTGFILIAAFVFRNLPVGVRSGMAGLSQVDKSLDEASTTLGASAYRTLTAVTFPLVKSALTTALIYSFVRSMTTVSAVIFLASAEYNLATVMIINSAINGDYGLAMAYCTVLIAIMIVAVAIINLLVGKRRIGRREAAPAIYPAKAQA